MHIVNIQRGCLVSGTINVQIILIFFSLWIYVMRPLILIRIDNWSHPLVVNAYLLLDIRWK